MLTYPYENETKKSTVSSSNFLDFEVSNNSANKKIEDNKKDDISKKSLNEKVL
jgi:hypothetical protein